MNAENGFQLPVQYRDQELEFPARLVLAGFQAKYIVLIEQVEIIFERDEQGEFRAIHPNANDFKGMMPEPALIEAVYKSISMIA